MKLALVFETLGPIEDGAVVPDGKGGTIELNNVRQNKFWAVPVGSTEPKVVVCIDHLEGGKAEYLEALALIVEKSYLVYH